MAHRTAAALAAIALMVPPALAQDPDASLAQDLTNCAGAVAAARNMDILTFPDGASGEWAETLERILYRLNREPGVEGMTGRYAASAARDFWREQPRAEREAAAAACRDRFGRAS